jgi:hypothetical protein
VVPDPDFFSRNCLLKHLLGYVRVGGLSMLA